MDIGTVSTALGTVKTATEIVSLLRQSDIGLKDAEQKMKLAELVGVLAELKTQLADVKLTVLEKDEKIKELEAKLALKAKVVWEAPYYWTVDGSEKDGPFCQKCQDADQKLIRLQDRENGCWACRVCENHYTDSSHLPVNQPNQASVSLGWMSR